MSTRRPTHTPYTAIKRFRLLHRPLDSIHLFWWTRREYFSAFIDPHRGHGETNSQHDYHILSMAFVCVMEAIGSHVTSAKHDKVEIIYQTKIKLSPQVVEHQHCPANKFYSNFHVKPFISTNSSNISIWYMCGCHKCSVWVRALIWLKWNCFVLWPFVYARTHTLARSLVLLFQRKLYTEKGIENKRTYLLPSSISYWLGLDVVVIVSVFIASRLLSLCWLTTSTIHYISHFCLSHWHLLLLFSIIFVVIPSVSVVCASVCSRICAAYEYLYMLCSAAWCPMPLGVPWLACCFSLLSFSYFIASSCSYSFLLACIA